MNFPFGIEEEFFVVSEDTQVLEQQAHAAFLARAKELSGGTVHREMLQSQVEAATPICNTFAEARRHLARSRRALAAAGRESGLAVISAGTHPTAQWTLQQQTDKTRYDAVMAELQILGFRNLVCGMHVHVEVPDDDLQARRHAPGDPVPAHPAGALHVVAVLARHEHRLLELSPDLLRRAAAHRPAAAVLRLAAISRLYRGAARGRRHPRRELHLVGDPPVPQVSDAGAENSRCLHLARGCHHGRRPLSLPRVRADGRSHDQQRHQFARAGRWRKRTSGGCSASACAPS